MKARHLFRPEVNFRTTWEIVRVPALPPAKLHLTAREFIAFTAIVSRGRSTTSALASIVAQRALLASLEGK